MSSDPYTVKLDLILRNQEIFAADLKVIKEAIKVGVINSPIAATVPSGGLYSYVRPVPLEPRYGKGSKMSSPDAYEAKKRSMYAINYQGGQSRSTDEEACWIEIDKLKAGDPKIIAHYDQMDPEFVGFGLLTNLFQPTTMQTPFIVWEQKYWAGMTIQSFLDGQWAIMQSGGTPSGG